MGTAIAIGVPILAVIGLVLAAFYYGRKTGRDSQRNRDLEKIDDVQDKQLDAANQPRTPDAVLDKLRRHEF